MGHKLVDGAAKTAWHENSALRISNFLYVLGSRLRRNDDIRVFRDLLIYCYILNRFQSILPFLWCRPAFIKPDDPSLVKEFTTFLVLVARQMSEESHFTFGLAAQKSRFNRH